jgi:hypothetical protein
MASVKQPLCIAKIREYVTRCAPQLTSKLPEREAHRRRVLGAQLALQQEASVAVVSSRPPAIASEPANATKVVSATAAVAPTTQHDSATHITPTVPLAVDINAPHSDNDNDQKHELPEGSWHPVLNMHVCVCVEPRSGSHVLVVERLSTQPTVFYRNQVCPCWSPHYQFVPAHGRRSRTRS